jgi:purine-binding chemotaxis protein CheW
MTKTFLDVKTLSPTEQALYAYLDDMLREVTESPAASLTDTVIEPSVKVQAETIQAAPTQTETAPTAAVPAAIPATAPLAAPAPTTTAPTTTALELTRTAVEVTADVIVGNDAGSPMAATVAPALLATPPAPSEMTSAPGWADNGRPLWAQSRFDVLIFKVAGLKLAVPLVSLGLIHPIDKKFHALPHQSDWFLGMLRVPGGNIKVIDTARHVMPERYTPACRENLKFVITLHGYEWGLACHEVHKALGMAPDAINWRTQRSKRPWMAGTVREHMCALIDAAGFHSVIEAVEQPLPR